MGLYVRPDSAYYWYAVDTPTGQVRRSTGVCVDAPSPQGRREQRQLAEAVFLAAAGDIVRDRWQLPRARAQVRFDRWVAWYAEHITRTHRGAEREREILKTLVGAFGAESLAALTRERVTEWVTARAARVAPRTINREVDLLKAMLRAAAEHGHLDASPLAGMRRLQVRKPVRRLMTPAEEARLLAELAPDDRAILLLGLDTLLRLSDILDLRREDDRGESIYIADPKDPRQAEPYEVPVSRRVRRALDALPESQPYYFPRRRIAKTERDRRGAYRTALARACKRAGVPYGRARGGITFHWATRRTGTTRMIQAGIDLATVQRLGHWRRPDVVLEIYAEGSSAAARRAVEVPGGATPNHVPITSGRKSRKK